MKPKISARKSSVKLIGMPTKMANSITTSIAMPSHSRKVMPRSSYLHFLAVLELAAEADLVPALQRLGYALDHEQQRGERHRGAERPHHRAPRGLLRLFPDGKRVESIVDADRHQDDERRVEEQQVGGEVDDPLPALRELLPEHVGAHVRALVQRVGAAKHEGRAVGHVARLAHPPRRRVEEG